jgi:hypothetical protein
MGKRYFTAVAAGSKSRVLFEDVKAIIKRRKKQLPPIPPYHHQQMVLHDDKLLPASSDEGPVSPSRHFHAEK